MQHSNNEEQIHLGTLWKLFGSSHLTMLHAHVLYVKRVYMIVELLFLFS